MTLSEFQSRSEVHLAKDEDQLWFRRQDRGWDVVHFDNRYRAVAEKDWQSVPDYALTGRSSVSEQGIVEAKFASNPDFDEQKISACAVRG
ncbi:hypothetical protein [Parvularcula maris]|uniref:Uncharacterized protein n=1 Tax=Parvularcula maris TaxID=2965077 RepID=A0A9X2RHV9_9PROT|nr:hypothetical protein [Parvularcula maris]MCQ8184336.1 hypothetical protein [Parvularcula maris]